MSLEASERFVEGSEDKLEGTPESSLAPPEESPSLHKTGRARDGEDEDSDFELFYNSPIKKDPAAKKRTAAVTSPGSKDSLGVAEQQVFRFSGGRLVDASPQDKQSSPAKAGDSPPPSASPVRGAGAGIPEVPSGESRAEPLGAEGAQKEVVLAAAAASSRSETTDAALEPAATSEPLAESLAVSVGLEAVVPPARGGAAAIPEVPLQPRHDTLCGGSYGVVSSIACQRMWEVQGAWA